MITLLTGENSFEIERYLSKITADFNGLVEKIDSNDLQIAQLPDILMGSSLFSTERLVVIRNLSENKTVWPVLGEWLSRVSSDVHLVLIEPKPDKRTTTFKSLKNIASLKEFKLWSERDISAAEKWLNVEAYALGFELNKKNIQLILRRVGLDQWRLFSALEKLALAGDISDKIIEDLIEASPTENVFNLLEVTLRGDRAELKKMLDILEQTEDVYQLFALLSSQVFQLLVVAVSGIDDDIVHDFGIHPFALSRIKNMSRQLDRAKIAAIITIFADTDDDMKKSRAEPWLLVERALLKVANL